MIDGLPEYIAFVALTGSVVHSFIRDFSAASIATTIIGTLGNLTYVTWASDFQVKPGWVLPLLVMGFVVALPVSFVVGVPHVLWRKSRQGKKSALNGPNREAID